jgi:PAS domain S-box-containing protein
MTEDSDDQRSSEVVPQPSPSFNSQSTTIVLDEIRLLHVDDDPPMIDLTEDMLAREDDRFKIMSESDPRVALDKLDEFDVDCIVSDFDMPQLNGLEFLNAVREEYPELPFILFTGKGSEEIASDAISSGVTDYLQKEGTPDQYAVLANRVKNAVKQYRAEKKIEQIQQRFRKLIEHSTDVISIVDQNGRWQFLTPSSQRILGYEPEELVGDIGFDHVHSDDQAEAIRKFNEAINNPDWIPTVEFRFDHPEKGWIWLENHARNMVNDPDINGFVVHTRDITERKEKTQKIERQNEWLEEFTDIVSHDLRNPLAVARGQLEFLREQSDTDRVHKVESALDWMEQIIDRTSTLARSGQTDTESSPVDLEAIVTQTWETITTDEASLCVEGSAKILANTDQMHELMENILQNAVDHGGSDVIVRVGVLEDGFFVADDGPGIPESDRESVLESGVSMKENGVGLGLAICKRIIENHGWEVEITESWDGGTRFEITGVKFHD